MKVGDLVKIIGSHDEGLEITSKVGIVMAPWKIDEWWVVMMPNRGIVHWPEAQMMRISDESR